MLRWTVFDAHIWPREELGHCNAFDYDGASLSILATLLFKPGPEAEQEEPRSRFEVSFKAS